MIKKYFIAIFLTFNCLSQNNSAYKNTEFFKTFAAKVKKEFDENIIPLGYPSSKINNFPKIKEYDPFAIERKICYKLGLDFFNPKTNEPIKEINHKKIFKKIIPQKNDFSISCSISSLFTKISKSENKTIFEYLLESSDSNMGFFEGLYYHLYTNEKNGQNISVTIFDLIHYLYEDESIHKSVNHGDLNGDFYEKHLDRRKLIINRFNSERKNKNFLCIKNKKGITPLMSIAMHKKLVNHKNLNLRSFFCTHISPNKESNEKEYIFIENNDGNTIMHCLANNAYLDASFLIDTFNDKFIKENILPILIKENKNGKTLLDLWYSNNLISFSSIFNNKNTDKAKKIFIFKRNNIAKIDEYLYKNSYFDNVNIKNKDIAFFWHRIFDHTINNNKKCLAYQHSIDWIEEVLQNLTQEQINSSDSRGITFIHNLIKKCFFNRKSNCYIFMKQFIKDQITKTHLDTQDLKGRSAFSRLFKNKSLCSEGDVNVCKWIKLFLKKDPNIYIKNKRGNTPIHQMLYLILKNPKLSVKIDEYIANKINVDTNKNASTSEGKDINCKKKSYTLNIQERSYGTRGIKSFCFTEVKKLEDIYNIKNNREQHPIEYALIKNAFWSEKNSSKFLLYLFMSNRSFNVIKEVYKITIKKHIDNKNQSNKQNLWINQFNRDLNPETIKRYNAFCNNIDQEKFFDARIKEMKNYVNNKYKLLILYIFKSSKAAPPTIKGYCLPKILIRKKILDYLNDDHFSDYICNIVNNKNNEIIENSFSKAIDYLKQLKINYNVPKCLYFI